MFVIVNTPYFFIFQRFYSGCQYGKRKNLPEYVIVSICMLVLYCMVSIMSVCYDGEGRGEREGEIPPSVTYNAGVTGADVGLLLPV